MSTDYKSNEETKQQLTFNSNRNCAPNYEAQAFTEHEKLLWITQDRIEKFLTTEGQWRDVNLSQKRFYYSYEPIKIEVYSPTFKQRPLFHEIINKNIKSNFKPCKIGDKFGPSWSSHWFKLYLNVPKSWNNKVR